MGSSLMRKILSLLLVPLFSLVIFLTSYSPLSAAATCTIENAPTEIAPRSSFEITITGGPPGAIIAIEIVERSGGATGITGGTIFSPSMRETVGLTAPTSEGNYTIRAHEGSLTGPLCGTAHFFRTCSECSSVSDPNAPAELGTIVTVIRNIIKLLVPVAAIAFFIMMIIGGAQFIFSGGDPKAAAGARSTLTYAIIGIILVVVSWLILLLVQNVTGVDVTSVVFPTLP